MDPSSLKILQGAAGAAGGDVIGVEDVFKNYVYEGTGSAHSINNGIDLSGEGGMVWAKNRGTGNDHNIVDTVRGRTKYLISNTNGVEQTEAGNGSTVGRVDSFSNNGFNLGATVYDAGWNKNGDKYVSWAFRKAEKFFDIVTYTGDGNSSKTLSHSLGSIPGCMLVKCTSHSDSWYVYHRKLDSGNQPETHYIQLNSTGTEYDDVGIWNDYAPTASNFQVGVDVNTNGRTYVVYLLAHEEAEFGPNSDQKIISCGSYEGTGSTGLEVNVGFESQWLMIKNIDRANTGWFIFDSMRALPVGGVDLALFADSNSSETGWGSEWIDLNATGFSLRMSNNDDTNKNGDTYIYIAIAAETGKTMKAIETGSDVFAMDTGNGSGVIPAFTSGFPVDFAFGRKPASAEDWYTWGRLIQGKKLFVNTTATESNDGAAVFDWNTGFNNNYPSTYQSWMWKRHAGFDVVTYTGVNPSSDAQSIQHSLGKIPEMMIIKKRSGTGGWNVYHKGLNGGTNPEQYSIQLNSSSAEGQYATDFNNTAPTSTHFTVGPGNSTNHHFQNYIAFLFASVNGVSSVGSYDGSNSTVTVPTSFQPRFVIIKRATGVGQWTVFDTTRGWGSGNDQLLELSDDAAQSNSYDAGAPTPTGFTVTSGQSAINNNGDKYIYYAHA
tara:strand:- start:328 stop:2307 length:1980 start_codon:yes stop_codon:yes gene_type:complete